MSIQKELEAIQRRNREGMLDPHEVLEWASAHPNSALHASIEWDDSKAAMEFRLYQIRRLIQIHVTTVEGDPVMVSLTIDRARGGGYRRISDVVRNRELSEIMLKDALNELQRVKARYERVMELTNVWREIDEISAKVAKPKRERRQRQKAAKAAKAAKPGRPRRRPSGDDSRPTA